MMARQVEKKNNLFTVPLSDSTRELAEKAKVWFGKDTVTTLTGKDKHDDDSKKCKYCSQTVTGSIIKHFKAARACEKGVRCKTQKIKP